MKIVKAILFLSVYLTASLLCAAQMRPDLRQKAVSAPLTTQAYRGYPKADEDIRAGFANPPKGYGNVPFFWWTGDSLKTERLAWELEVLADSPTEGFSVSYHHNNPRIDNTLKSAPDPVFNPQTYGGYGSPDRGRPVAFGDDWWKLWNDFSGLCADKGLAAGLDDYVFAWPGNHSFMDRVITAEQLADYQGKLNCKTIHVNDGLPDNVLWKKAVGQDSLKLIFTTPHPALHPQVGNVMVREYFQDFENHLDARGRNGMNFFFQDELMFSADLYSWSEDMPEQFLARKGYDILPHLAELFEDGEGALKTRLDYAEVVTELSEERYFKPIYDWNASRGLIYGCDNEGRGLHPAQYLDYFRAISWFTAPGNDAPARGSSFLQTKVSSSVAHLYDRPRTWLEAFHSMGWDANGAVLTHQLDHHIIAGGNLLCMHGLYYTTHGSWWEWAPPCFHFRMPYWPHMKKWLKYAQHLCYVLSQGNHVCDIAILYPTEPSQVLKDYKPDFNFEVADKLSEAGFDFDFIDYKSLQNATVVDGKLCIADESYKLLVLAGIDAMHEETAAAVEAFRTKGGNLLVLGENADKAVEFAKRSIVPDFKSMQGKGRVLHRRVGENEVYMVMDVQQGDSLFLRSHGKLECWDAMSGKISEQKVISCDENGTWLRFDAPTGCSKLFVFSEGEASVEGPASAQPRLNESISLDGLWDIQLVPTMDNHWGDYRLPATDGMIAAEARSFECVSKGYNDKQIFGYAPYMLTSNVDDQSWKPYCWSWQYGVPDSPGSQGYHGLKAMVDSRFIILDQGCDQYFKTAFYAPEDGSYRIIQEGVVPDIIGIDGIDTAIGTISLSKGWHQLYLLYKDTESYDYKLEQLVSNTSDPRKRSMVMIYPAASELPADADPYDNIVASRWYGTDYLKFNAFTPSAKTVYSFDTAPGTSTMDTKVKGKVLSVKVDGKPVKFAQNGDQLVIAIKNVNKGISNVQLAAVPDPFCPGSAFFEEPVRMNCMAGQMPVGDWTSQGAMRHYSGGVRYIKTVNISQTSGKWILDLGEVDATCELWVNGYKVDELISKPYHADITTWLHKGENKVEVLVYSSLANHYQTIPTPYRGQPHAGLCGPVELKHYD